MVTRITSYISSTLLIVFMFFSSADIYCQPNKKFKVTTGTYILNYKNDTLHSIRFRSVIPFHTIRYTVTNYNPDNEQEQYQLYVDRIYGRVFRQKITFRTTFYIFENRIIESWNEDDTYIYFYDSYSDYPDATIARLKYGSLKFEEPEGYHMDLFEIIHSDISRHNTEPKSQQLGVWCYFQLRNMMEDYKDSEELTNLINKYISR